MRIAILASGNGSNFEAIVQAVERGDIQGEVALLFSDKKEANVLKRAAKYQVPAYSFAPKQFDSKEKYEAALCELLVTQRIDLVVLAGYMRIIGNQLLQAFPQQIINIHPSLLPSFPGLHGVKDAFEYGVKVTGITIHFIDDGIDTGPIIAQETIAIDPEETLPTLEEKIHQLEHQWYPKVIATIVEKRSNQI
ncbi:phosphoribosylglycinamide formyltransferase [Enterococcus saccharolyticus]|uniref:phosphoribosylglycinamide formyltransferase n=1 Tax=Enterococcus saccharolyticus TaxID=41997 RepID=UPI001E46535D|nr:phosphoribosylglycinamide formyltransferase [Enterococcus saccharolyticus]MCD5002458.1 phosphoribosylglycinamide formyltransferase [Enterococcus saccharolyticus]